MKTIELLQRIQSLYSKGVNSDDSRLMNRHIYNKLLTVRARLISQEAKKKQKISQWNYQKIPCIELIEVPSHDCPCIPPIGCSILRSKHRLPSPLSGLSGNLIQSVTTINRQLKLDEININAVRSQKGNKYTAKKTNFFIEDKYLYISTPTKMEIVSMVALFEDPLEVNKFSGYCDCQECTQCSDFEQEEFPIDNDLIDVLIELSVNELIQIFNSNFEDTTNNGRDNLKEQSK